MSARLAYRKRGITLCLELMVHPTLHQCSDQTWLLEAMTAAEVLALEVGLIHSFKMAAIILNLAPHLLVQQQIYS